MRGKKVATATPTWAFEPITFCSACKDIGTALHERRWSDPMACSVQTSSVS